MIAQRTPVMPLLVYLPSTGTLPRKVYGHMAECDAAVIIVTNCAWTAFDARARQLGIAQKHASVLIGPNTKKVCQHYKKNNSKK